MYLVSIICELSAFRTEQFIFTAGQNNFGIKIPNIFSGWNFEKMQLCAMIASHCDGMLEQWVENCCSVLLQSSIESKLRALNSQRFTVWCPDFIDMKFCFYSNLSIFQRFAGYANQNRFFFFWSVLKTQMVLCRSWNTLTDKKN